MYILPFFSAQTVSDYIRIPKAYHTKLILENLLLKEGREKNRGGTEKRNMRNERKFNVCIYCTDARPHGERFCTNM